MSSDNMRSNNIRSNRKLDHIKYALDKKRSYIKTGLDDIVLIHNAMPDYDLQDIDTGTTFLGKSISAPIYINAMTGGHQDVKEINEELSKAAATANIPIAVGSQMAAVKDKSLISTYSVVRKLNPEGVVISNISANCKLEEARTAIEMLEADAIQLHLNVAQEAVMSEGETKFAHISDNIAMLVAKLKVPVIVKEVGCGMSSETIKKLMDIGAGYIDISGAGGTNFIDIELSRAGEKIDYSLAEWGISTAYSMIEAKHAGCTDFMVSGGIRNSIDIAKCISMGAAMAGISGEALRQYYSNNNLIDWLDKLKKNLRIIMLLTNSCTIEDLKKCNKVIKGELLEWDQLRK